VLLARLAGNTDLVKAQWTALASMGDVAEVPADRWGALRESEPQGAATARLSHRPAHRFDVWLHALSLAERLPGAWVHASVGRGIARLVAPAADPSALAAAFAPGAFVVGGEPGTRIFERLPGVLWPALSPSALPPNTAGELMRKVKDAYDPHDLLNPGIMGIKVYGA
jgi:hypothetical protein